MVIFLVVNLDIMSQLQKFLYAYASKPLTGKAKQSISSDEDEDEDFNIRKRSICVDRFDNRFSKQSDIHAEDYSSCIYCDVEVGKLIR